MNKYVILTLYLRCNEILFTKRHLSEGRLAKSSHQFSATDDYLPGGRAVTLELPATDFQSCITTINPNVNIKCRYCTLDLTLSSNDKNQMCTIHLRPDDVVMIKP